jgi:hypothetical protein
MLIGTLPARLTPPPIRPRSYTRAEKPRQTAQSLPN